MRPQRQRSHLALQAQRRVYEANTQHTLQLRRQCDEASAMIAELNQFEGGLVSCFADLASSADSDEDSNLTCFCRRLRRTFHLELRHSRCGPRQLHSPALYRPPTR